MATATLGSQSVGSIVKLRVNGESLNFIVAHQGCPSALYDSSCTGTWLLMQDIYSSRAFDASSNELAKADLTAWLNDTFASYLPDDVRTRLVEAKLPYVPEPMADAKTGADGLACKVFLLSQGEVGLSTGSYASGDGALLGYFTQGVSTAANSRRVAKLNGEAAAWWLRSPYALNYTTQWLVGAAGAGERDSITYAAGVRPALILPTGMYVTDDGGVSGSMPPSAPGYITLPDEIAAGAAAAIAWAAAASGEGAISGYRLERSTNGGASYTQIYAGSALSYTDTIDSSWTRVKYRVCAYDSYDVQSAYTTSVEHTVKANTAPVVSGAVENGASLGSKSAAFSLQYTVTDADGDAVTVSEYLDGALKKSAAAPLGAGCELKVSAGDMLALTNDASHTLKITASDGKVESEAYTVTFLKAAHTASVTLTKPISSAEPIRAVLLKLEGDIPLDALLSVLVSNNAADEVPVWENATQAVRTAQSYAFTNQSAANGYALNFQISVSRGASGEGGTLTAISGSYSSGTVISGGTGTGTGGTGSSGLSAAYLDLFSVMGSTANQKLWNAINAGGIYSGSNQTMALSYAECTPPGRGLGAARYYIAYRDDYPAMSDTGAETVIRDTIFKPEGAAPVLLQPVYKSGTLTFENCTFKNVLFWFGETAAHRFVFRNCIIEDNEYNFIQCGETNANAEYVIEGCTFRHMRPDKAEYRADIVPLKLNGWAHGNIRCLGYDVKWTIRDTLFEDCMGQLNIFFGKSSLVEPSPERVKLYMERCTIQKTNGAGISFSGQPVTGWIRDCSFLDIGANRCSAEGYDLPADSPVHSGSGTEADPYVYTCGVGGNAIFSYNTTPRHELVISGNHIARVMENGIEGNYREVSANHIEQTGCRLSEGLYTPSTEGIYGNICVCKGNVVRNPGGGRAAIIIPRGYSDGEACFYEDNLLICDDEAASEGSGFAVMVEAETLGYPLSIKGNTIRGFAHKYDMYNSQAAELTGISIADTGADDEVIKRADYNQNSLLGVHYEAPRERAAARDAAFASFNSDGSLKEWVVSNGTAKVYATAQSERFLRLIGTSGTACAALAQDFTLGSDIYLARVRCRVRSSSGKVGFAPLSVNDAGEIVAGVGEIVFNPQMAVLEVHAEAGANGFAEVTHTMAVTQNCRISILNPGYDAAEGAETLSQLDIKDVEITFSRCLRGQSGSGAETEAGALFDFSTLSCQYAPAAALRVNYYLPGSDTAYTGTWADAAWSMGQYTGGTKGRGRVVLNADSVQYGPLTVWYKSEFDLELGGHTLECSNANQYGFLQLFNGADVTIKGPGALKAKNYALTLAAGCKCTLSGGVSVSGEGDWSVYLGAGSAGARTELSIENAAVGDVLAAELSTVSFELDSAASSATVSRLQTNGKVSISAGTKLVNNGVTPAVEVQSVQQATGLFYSTQLECTYAAGHTAAAIEAAGDESSVYYSYLDSAGQPVSGEATLSGAFSRAKDTSATRQGEMNIRLESDAYTYSGFWVQNAGEVSLNLNGHKIYTEHQSFALYINSGCSFTVYDSSSRGAGVGEISSADYSAVIVNGTGARLELSSGKVSQPTGNCVRAENGAAIEVAAEAVLAGKTGVSLGTNTQLTLSGGAITATDMCVQATPEQASTTAITVSGGALTSDNVTIYAKNVTFAAAEGSTATLNGTLSLTQPAVIAQNTAVTVDGEACTELQNASGLVVVSYEGAAQE